MRKIVGLLLLVSLATAVNAVQKFEGNPDEIIAVKASTTDPNIISITGGSIESVWGTEDKVALEANVETGQAIFRPATLTPFTLFVQTLAGNTYTLAVTPQQKLIGQSIVINEFGTIDQSGVERNLGIVAYKNVVKRLLRTVEQMQGVQKLRGFSLVSVNKEKPLWVETQIVHVNSWRRSDLIIDRYLITNITDKKLVMEEREFISLERMIRAISIRKHTLAPAESSVMYTVRERS